MILYLVRHGQTGHNRDGLGLGRDDVPLTALGERQAAALGARLAGTKVERAFSSPLKRARQTAEALAHGVTIEPREELTEMDVGLTEGLDFAEMRRRFPEFLVKWRGDRPDLVSMPGGESLIEVAARLAPFIDELSSSEHNAVVLVSHNFTLKVLLCGLLGLELPHFRAFTLGVASLSVVSTAAHRWTIESLNDCSHLSALEP